MTLQALQAHQMMQWGMQSMGPGSTNPANIASRPSSGRQSVIPSVASAPLTPTSLASAPFSNANFTGTPMRTAVVSNLGRRMPQPTHNVSLPRGGPVLTRTPVPNAFSNPQLRAAPGAPNSRVLQYHGVPQSIYSSHQGVSPSVTGTTVSPAPSFATSQPVAAPRPPYNRALPNQALSQLGGQGDPASETIESTERMQLRTNLNTFMFAQVALADKVVEFAESTRDRDKKGTGDTLFGQMMHGLRATFWFLFVWGDDLPEDLRRLHLRKAKLSFVYRNFITIGFTTVAQTVLDGDVFIPYSITMSSTLAVLISQYPGSASYRNLMRLLGVTLGKVLPIIIMAFVVIWKHSYPSVAHLIMIFVYMTYFTYMYYASKDWGFVGCLIAGFGCYTLAGTHVSLRVGSSVFEARYKEIGQVTAAIIFQFVIDAVDNLIFGGFPRDRIFELMTEFCYDSASDTYGTIVEGFEAFFDGNFEKMRDLADEAKKKLALEKRLLEEAHTKTVLSPGYRKAFRFGFVCKIIDEVERLLNEMDVLVLVKMHMDEEADKNVHAIQKTPSAFCGRSCSATGAFDDLSEWEAVKSEDTELVEFMKRTMRMLMMVLDHTREGTIKLHEDFMPRGQEKLGVRKDAPKESVRVSVAWRAINSSYKATCEIEHLCISTGIFK